MLKTDAGGPDYYAVFDDWGRSWIVLNTAACTDPNFSPAIRVKEHVVEKLRSDSEAKFPDWDEMVREGRGDYALFAWRGRIDKEIEGHIDDVYFVADIQRDDFLRMAGYTKDPAPKQASGFEEWLINLYPLGFMILVAFSSLAFRLIFDGKVGDQYHLFYVFAPGIGFYAILFARALARDYKKYKNRKESPLK